MRVGPNTVIVVPWHPLDTHDVIRPDLRGRGPQGRRQDFGPTLNGNIWTQLAQDIHQC